MSNDSSLPPYGRRPEGYRLPAEAHPGAVRLAVSDLERSLDYYQRVLGFEVRERTPGVARLGTTGGGPSLIELHEEPGARSVARSPRLGLYHFAILMPDRASLGRFLAHLGQIGQYAGMSDHLVSEALYLRDPDGLGIEVYADRPRSTWAHHDGELAMAADPLDVENLVRAGGDEPWTGMPTGTRVGHMHLHVGDLERAAAFYHNALGFDLMAWSYPGALFFGAGGYHHHLGTNTWATGATSASEGDARLLEWELLFPSDAAVREALSSVESAGYPVQRTDDGGTVRDPWGTWLRLRSV